MKTRNSMSYVASVLVLALSVLVFGMGQVHAYALHPNGDDDISGRAPHSNPAQTDYYMHVDEGDTTSTIQGYISSTTSDTCTARFHLTDQYSPSPPPDGLDKAYARLVAKYGGIYARGYKSGYTGWVYFETSSTWLTCRNNATGSKWDVGQWTTGTVQSAKIEVKTVNDMVYCDECDLITSY